MRRFLRVGVVVLLGCGDPPRAEDRGETTAVRSVVPSTPPATTPRECNGGPCCGDPPQPCGAVLDAAIGKPCTTACDCAFPGLACHDGACRSGTEAVYCCEACPQQAPAAQACQQRDGSFARCGTANAR